MTKIVEPSEDSQATIMKTADGIHAAIEKQLGITSKADDQPVLRNVIVNGTILVNMWAHMRDMSRRLAVLTLLSIGLNVVVLAKLFELL